MLRQPNLEDDNMNSREIGPDQRLLVARNMATAKVSSSRVANSVSASQVNDLVTTLSSEALNVVSKREGSSGRPEQITQALSAFMINVNVESSEEAKPSRKRKVVNRKVDWNPSTRAGEVKEGLSAMGRLRVSDEITEEESPQSRSGRQTSLGISIQGSAAGGGRIQMSLNQTQSKDSATEKPKVVGGEALHNLMKNGMVADGLSSLINGGFQGNTGSQIRELTVRTNGTGRQRVMSVKSAGTLDKNTSVLGAFQMMENKPIVKRATDSQGYKEAKALAPAHIFGSFLGR